MPVMSSPQQDRFSIPIFRILLFSLFCLVCSSPKAIAQTFNEILGRPTDKSITISSLFSQVVEVKFDYGTSPTDLSFATSWLRSIPDTPVVMELKPLEANKRYFYRTTYRLPGSANFKSGPDRTFHTQRAPGSRFTFTLEADEHLYDKKGIPSLYRICLDNQAADSADFVISLGDTFGDDHTPLETSSEDMRLLHLDYRQYLGQLCHSSPFFFCLGNHEGESGYWLDQTPPYNIAVYGTNWRKFYYPNPFPNEFYSGNSTQEPWGIGYPENYYAFQWGDALFVILDVYRDCDVDEKPKNWDWTLGETQYNWFKKTLETSNASHKLVFAHHNRGQGRGGILPSRGYEWGGYGNNGNGAWEFDKMRPGWEMPIHQLMAAHGVKIFFQGHDHLYAWEKMDDVVYQEVPMPSDTTYQIGMLANADAYTDITLDGSGHLRVTVDASCVTVDYVAAYLPKDTLDGHKNREIRHSYTLGTCTSSTDDKARTRDLSAFEVFPNPARDLLTIRATTPSPHDRSLSLYNTQGQLVRSEVLGAGSENLKLDLSGVAPGIYQIRFLDRQNSNWKKVMIH